MSDVPAKLPTKPDGGAAFPIPSLRVWDERAKQYRDVSGNRGMTLRDHFAAEAMSAQIALEGMEGCDKQNIAAMSYELADVMIAERNK